MTEPVNEQLSACLDGELPAAELDLLLKRLQRNPELRQAVDRYTVIGEALRHSKPAVAARSFADRVMAAVDQEPAAPRQAPRISPTVLRRLTPVAGFGLAATVAAIAMAEVGRALRFLNVILGAWVAVAPWLSGGVSTGARLTALTLGLAVAALSIPRGSVRERYGSAQRLIV